MFESDLLVTKFTLPPMRAGLLQRSHLLSLLDQKHLAPLTLLSASAGFGKTTLLAAWASQYAGKIAWLALDEQDNDPARFWSYVIAALRKSGFPIIGTGAEALLHASQPALLTGALTSLINEIAALEDTTALILDDYHLIRAPELHASLQFVIEHLPTNLHILLASRADPPLPLARLRARGQVMELRERDLRLSQEEAARFLSQTMGLSLTVEELERLDARTEGWIAGLQLAALSLRNYTNAAAFLQTFTGSHRFIFDYVQEEIIAPLPEEQQRFLLDTSVLTRLEAGICQTLTGEEASQQMLERLEQENLFLLPLDEERRWYRFHALFREVLLARLQATQPERVLELHRQAALWYRQQNLLHEAISHALATGDNAFVAELLEAGVERLSLQGELQTLLSWIKQLPIETLRAHPRLATSYLLIFNLLFPFTQQEQHESVYLQRLQQNAEMLLTADQPSLSVHEQTCLSQRLAILEAWKLTKKALSAGDREQLIQLAAQLQPPELDDDILWQQHGLAPFAMTWRMAGNFPPLVTAIQKMRRQAPLARDNSQDVHVLWGLIAAQIALGQLREADASCQELRQLIRDYEVPLPLAAYPDLFQAQLSYAWNSLESAQDAARQAIREAAPLHYMDILMGAYEVLVRTSLASGDLVTAQETLKAMEQEQRSASIPLFQPWIEGLQAHIWLAQGDLARAADWAEHTPYYQEALSGGVYSREATYLVLVRVLLAQARYPQALQLLAALLRDAEQVARAGSIIALQALQVTALQASGATQDALNLLSHLLADAQTQGYVRAFLDAGEPMRQALQAWLRAEQKTLAPGLFAYAQLLSTAFASEPGPQTKSASSTSIHLRALPQSASPLLEPLTGREQEVLLLLAEGATNQEIAERLVVSLTTVKKHVGSLLLKLAADNRTHAVARARELSLL